MIKQRHAEHKHRKEGKTRAGLKRPQKGSLCAIKMKGATHLHAHTCITKLVEGGRMAYT